MSQSHSYRERRNAVAAWLHDRYGTEDEPDAAYWRDAADFLKFLTDNGFEVVLR